MLVEKITHEPKDIVFIYTTCHSADEARSIGLASIEERLAISADYWVIGSIYPWRGVIQDVDQYMLMLTTQKFLSEKLIKYVGALHSYSAPMITRLDTAMMNPTYNFWVENTLNGSETYITEEERIIRDQNESEDGYHYGKLK
jgi:uncharacterized protein involved in tolerance to divalent cations